MQSQDLSQSMKNIDIKDVDSRLDALVFETFQRMKSDEKLHKLRKKYAEKQKKKHNKDKSKFNTSFFAQGYTPSGKSPKDPTFISEVLNTIVQDNQWQGQLSQAKVTVAWDEIVGESTAAHIKVEKFEKGILYVRASSSAWAQQMKFLLPTLHRKIDAVVGQDVVKKVNILAPTAPNWRKGKFHVKGRGPRDTYG